MWYGRVMTAALRVPIRFNKPYALLSTALWLRPSDSYLELDGEQVHVRMAWGFRATFARRAVQRAERYARKPLSHGIHGWAGRWLVNGANDRILAIDLEPAQRAWVLGFPVRLRELLVSVDEPEALAAQLTAAA